MLYNIFEETNSLRNFFELVSWYELDELAYVLRDLIEFSTLKQCLFKVNSATE